MEQTQTDSFDAGNSSSEVFASVPKEVRFNKEGVDRLERFKGSPDEVAKSYLEMESQFGSRVKIPDEKTTPEEVRKFYQKLGCPETPDKYEIKRPEKMPEGLSYDETLEKIVIDIAFKHGVSNKALAEIADAYNQYQLGEYGRLVEVQKKQNETQRAAQSESNVKAVKELWGDNFEKEVHIAQRAVEKYGDEELVKYLNESGSGDNPHWVRFCNKIGHATLDDTLVKGLQSTEEKFVPQWPNSPEMYRDDIKGRAYFESKGYKY